MSAVRSSFHTRSRPNTSFGKTLALGIVLLLTGLFIGALTAYAPPLAVALGAASIAAVLGVVLPLPWLLVSTLLVSAVVAGSAEYFLRISQANWIPYILACLLAVRGLVESQLTVRENKPITSNGFAWFAYPAILYLFVLFASVIANLIPAQQAFAAAKNYLMLWGILVGMLSLKRVDRSSTLIWRSALLVAAVQLPVVLYQRLFVSSALGNSASGLSFDAINGTFGGGVLGGRSGALAMFICIALGYLLILWRDRKIGFTKLFALLLLMLPSLFIVEVKAVIFWLPFVALLVFGGQIRKRPVLFILGLATSIVLVVGVIGAYRYSYYNPSGDRSLSSFFTRDLSYFWDPDRFNAASRELGRISALVHWWREAQSSGIAHWLFGYGPGASRGISSLAVGSIAAKYPFFIDTTAASTLLWDVGVVGLVSFCGIFILGSIEARKLSKLSTLPEALRRQLEAAKVGLLLLLSSVIYIRDAIDGATVQFMVFFFLGLIIHARRIAYNRTVVDLHEDRAREAIRQSGRARFSFSR